MVVELSTEQRKMIDLAISGRDVIVEATVGSGKTSSIQQLCLEMSNLGKRVLYLTYSRLLKHDAQARVGGARVQNYHGVVYPSLVAAGITCGISDSIRVFNDNFESLKSDFPVYDILVIDEYQDITEEYARLLVNIKSMNPAMQVVMVGDMEQRVKSNTRLDVRGFALDFCDNPQQIGFTQSFRMGPQMAKFLSAGWNKTVVGRNVDQVVRRVNFKEAMDRLAAADPGEVLCLGKRTNGWMSVALNELEKKVPEKYNKNTVYASIKDGDDAVSYDDNTAVFTTFDSSKGLERPLCVLFDYDMEWWTIRGAQPNTDMEILRNVFLVAASRGKAEILFVGKKQLVAEYSGNTGALGFIPVSAFRNLPGLERTVYDRPVAVAEAFDFKYAEDVVSLMDTLELTRLDTGKGRVIDIERSDGLIDLSPAVGNYQEALFFNDYSPLDQLQKFEKVDAEGRPVGITSELYSELNKEPWRDSLVVTAADTQQRRYIDQVHKPVPKEVTDALVARLSEHLDPMTPSQLPVTISGIASDSGSGEISEMSFAGIIDTMVGDTVWELKFVSELSPEMFLQTAMYVVMIRARRGVLWNTRTDERWEVKVGDPARFLDAVVSCTSKHDYDSYRVPGIG